MLRTLLVPLLLASSALILEAQEVLPETPRAVFERKLAASPFFSKIDLVADVRHAPLHVYVQPPKKQDAAYVGRVADAVAAHYADFAPRLESFLGPAPTEARFLPVIVLASRADYDTFRRVANAELHWLYRAEASYLTELRAVVLFETPFTEPAAPTTKAFSTRLGLATLLLDERIDRRRSALHDWFAEGFAELAAGSLGAPESRPGPGLVFPDELATYVRLLRRTPRRELVLSSFRTLATIRHWSGIGAHVRRLDGADRKPEETYRSAPWAFLAQSRLTAWFLFEEHAAAARAHLTDWLAGEPIGASFARHFPNAGALEREFVDWLQAEILLADPQSTFDVNAAPEPHEPDSGRSQVRPEPETFELERGAQQLALVAPAADERLALAFAALARGSTEEGLRWLEGLEVERPDDPDWSAWVAAERQRALAWRTLRDAFVATLVESGETLTLEQDERRARARVVAVEDGVLRFEKNRALIHSVAVEELDPRILARAMPKKLRTWAVALPDVWTRDDRAKRSLRGDEPELEALRGDVETRYPALDPLRDALDDFLVLAQFAAPASADDARAQLDVAREHIAGNLSNDVFANRLDLIEAWVRGRLVSEAEAVELEELVHGRLERLGDDRIALHYDFGDDEQLRDFVSDEMLGKQRHLETLPVPADVLRELSIRSGALFGLGSGSYVHAVTLGGPLRLSATLTFVAEAGLEHPFSVYLGFTTGGSNDGIWLEDFHRLSTFEGQRADSAALPPMRMTLKLPYRLEVTQQGAKVEATSNGLTIGPLAGPATPQARFALLPHSAWAFTLDDLRLEGAFGPAERARTLASVVERREAVFWLGLR